MTPQHMAALEKANEVRFRTARLKREIGDLPPREALEYVVALLENDHEDVMPIRVYSLLRAIPRVGTSKARVLVREIQVNDPQRTVGRLSVRQRRTLARALADEAWRLRR